MVTRTASVLILVALKLNALNTCHQRLNLTKLLAHNLLSHTFLPVPLIL